MARNPLFPNITDTHLLRPRLKNEAPDTDEGYAFPEQGQLSEPTGEEYFNELNRRRIEGNIEYARERILHGFSDVRPRKLSDRSGSIATADVAQIVVNANEKRRYFLFQNISVVTMFINFWEDGEGDKANKDTANNPNSIRLNAGDSLIFENGFIPSNEVWIICATAGSDYICKEA